MDIRYTRETPYVHEAALLNFRFTWKMPAMRALNDVYSRVNFYDRKSNKQTAEEVTNLPRCKNIERFLSSEQAFTRP